MKKILLLFLAVSLTFISCEEEENYDADNIVGSWECSRIEIDGVYNELSSSLAQILMPEYNFNEDGSGAETNIFGTYDFTWDLGTDKVLTISTDSDSDTYQLEKLTDSEFVYKSTSDDDEELEVTYKKQ